METLLEDIVCCHVGPVYQFGYFEAGYFEVVFCLAERISCHVWDRHLTLCERVDGDIYLSAGFYVDLRFWVLFEDDSAVVDGYVERIVHDDFEFVFFRHVHGIADCDAGEVRNLAAGTVTGSELHEIVCGDEDYDHREDDLDQGREQRRVVDC